MTRYLGCLAVSLLIGAPLCAGELDGEFAKASPAPSAQKDRVAPVKASPVLATTAALPKGSELDGEAPADAYRGWRGGGWRGGWGFGWNRGWGGGWGYGWRGGWGRGWGYGWAGWYRPWYGVGYWPSYAYYAPSYVSYGYGYGGLGYCW